MANTIRDAIKWTAALVCMAGFAAALSACTPRPTLTAVNVPATWTFSRLVAIDDAGLAVGASDGGRAFTDATGTGTVTDISTIAPNAEFPNGGTFHDPTTINDQGVVLGYASAGDSPNGGSPALYDTATHTIVELPCPGPTSISTKALSNGGLVACGTQLYDSHTANFINVVQPDGCNGTIEQVNDHVAVGYCDNGDEPYFVSDLTTGVTTAFGAAQELYDPNHGHTSMARLTDGNLLVANLDLTHSYVYDVSGGTPTSVPVGTSTVWPGMALGASDSGLVAVSEYAGANDPSTVVVVDTTTGKARSIDAPLPGMLFPYGVNDGGMLVGAVGTGVAVSGAVSVG